MLGFDPHIQSPEPRNPKPQTLNTDVICLGAIRTYNPQSLDTPNPQSQTLNPQPQTQVQLVVRVIAELSTPESHSRYVKFRDLRAE
jgi:hypothetical protein